MARRAKALKRALPRAPLPRQTGGVHSDKTKQLDRRRKHKGRRLGDRDEPSSD